MGVVLFYGMREVLGEACACGVGYALWVEAVVEELLFALGVLDEDVWQTEAVEAHVGEAFFLFEVFEHGGAETAQEGVFFDGQDWSRGQLVE